ncbi:MAG: glycosyltransferase family 4 protein [Firmicutes bacterium]|nr:glycosyltransferase family 4 protein [Bacillota bacterium]
MSAPEKRVIRVVMLGPALDVKGGVSSVERLILAHAPDHVRIRHIATMRDGRVWVKLAVFLLALTRFLKVLLMRRADLIHIHFASRASTWRKSLLALVARWFSKPYILHAHGAEFHEFFPKQPRLLQRWIISMLRKSRALITVSERWKQFYLNISGLPSEHVVVLPNPISVPEGCPSRRDRSTVTLLFLGRMENRKGPIRVVRAFHALPDELRRRAYLVLAGDGDVEGVRREVSALGLEQQVTVLDWVNAEQRNALLAAADVFVLPSLNEGLPMSVLEAMSWGIPVVTSPVGGIPEVVQDGFNGFLVPPEDIPALANALQRLIEDESLRLQMGANARASVEHLDIRRYWEKLEGIYRAVLSECRP